MHQTKINEGSVHHCENRWAVTMWGSDEHCRFIPMSGQTEVAGPVVTQGRVSYDSAVGFGKMTTFLFGVSME